MAAPVEASLPAFLHSVSVRMVVEILFAAYHIKNSITYFFIRYFDVFRTKATRGREPDCEQPGVPSRHRDSGRSLRIPAVDAPGTHIFRPRLPKSAAHILVRFFERKTTRFFNSMR